MIYLIDNGSHDESIKKLEPVVSGKAKIIWHKEPENTGFAGGVNIGIKYAMDKRYKYVVLLNNDIKVEPDWLTNLVGAAEKQKVSAVASLMMDYDGEKIIETGDIYSIWGVPMLRDEGKKREEASLSGYIFGGTGGSILFRTKMFEDIGLFDAKYFAYDEDVDIDWRAQLAGHKFWFERTAVVYHKHHATSNKMSGFTIYQLFKNMPMVVWKNVPWQLMWRILPRFLLAYTMYFWYRSICKGDFVPAMKGFLRSLTLYPHMLRERRRIQKNRQVSIAYLDSILYHELPPVNKKRLQRFFHRKTKVE
jgi:GT2 family glycosyltransferase